jgi:hypothetical protein
MQSLAKLVITFPKNPFMKWGLDFIAPIKPFGQYIGNSWYILVAMIYVIMRVEVKVLHTNNIVVTTKFLYEFILTKFTCPLSIVIDQGVHFIIDAIKYLTNHFMLKHVSSTTYYP